jgi:hypothetical protein
LEALHTPEACLPYRKRYKILIVCTFFLDIPKNPAKLQPITHRPTEGARDTRLI